jgi:hypothetical protein
MKKIITILFLMMVPFMADAQQRIRPVFNDVNHEIYDEAVELLYVMERAAIIEKMEGIKLNTNYLTTKGGEVALHKDKNSIKITSRRFSTWIDDHQMTHQNYRWDDVEVFQTEMIIQNVKLFEYISERLVKNPNVKNMILQVEPKTGMAYIRINYYNL